MAEIGLQVASLMMLGLAAGGLAGWGRAVVGWYRGRPLLTPEPRLPASWHFSECLLCVGLYLMLVIVLQGTLVSLAPAFAAPTVPAAETLVAPEVAPEVAGDPTPQGRPLDHRAIGLAITADGIAKSLAIGAVLLWMMLLDRASAARLGLRLTARDLKIGIVASAMLLPPILLFQAALNLWFPYQHPVLDVINQGPGLWLGVAMVVNTVAIAPVAEEFFFRGLVQGWLQRLGFRSPVRRIPVPTTGSGSDQAALAGGADAAAIGGADPALVSGDQVAGWPWWPVVASSLLFALAHLSQGAAPVSLFLLALGLGYLYRQTGRLAAPIIVHMVLNGLSTAITFLAAAAGEGPLP